MESLPLCEKVGNMVVEDSTEILRQPTGCHQSDVLDKITDFPTPNEFYFNNCCELNFDLLPGKAPLDGVACGNILYIEAPVNAVTTRKYLKSRNPHHKISRLFTLKTGAFYPVTEEILIS